MSSGKQEEEKMVEKSRIEADTHLGKRRQADRKGQWSQLPTADICAKAEQEIPYIPCGFKALGSSHPPSWDNHTCPSHSTFKCIRQSIIVVHMSQKGFSLFWVTLLKYRWSLKSTLNFQALGTFRVHQLNCYQTQLWGALRKSGGKEGGEELSKCRSESPAPPFQPEQSAFTCLIYICAWTSSCTTKKG